MPRTVEARKNSVLRIEKERSEKIPSCLFFGLWCGVAEISPPPPSSECMERDKSRMIRRTEKSLYKKRWKQMRIHILHDDPSRSAESSVMFVKSGEAKTKMSDEAHGVKCFMSSGHVYELWISIFQRAQGEKQRHRELRKFNIFLGEHS